MSKIKDALAKLDPQNDNHWTSDGLPRIDTIRMFASDPSISRELITAEAPDFSRSNPVIPGMEAVAAVVTDSSDTADNVVSGEGSILTAAEYDEKIAEAQAKLQDAINILNAAQGDVNEAQNELDAIINEKYDVGVGDTNADIIQGYLASQQSDLAERGRRSKVLQDSGVTLRDIQALIPQASPLDRAIASKKK